MGRIVLSVRAPGSNRSKGLVTRSNDVCFGRGGGRGEAMVVGRRWGTHHTPCGLMDLFWAKSGLRCDVGSKMNSWAKAIQCLPSTQLFILLPTSTPKPLHGDLRFQEHLDGWGSWGPLDQLDACLASNLG